MATTQQANITIEVKAQATKNGRGTTGRIGINNIFTYGTSASQSDKGYYDSRTIAYSSTPDNLDFAGGGLVDLNGDAITWVEMVGLVIYNSGSVDLVVGNGTNPLNFGCNSNTITIKAGETKVLINCPADGSYPISAESSDNLKIAIASGTNATYEIWAIGRSA